MRLSFAATVLGFHPNWSWSIRASGGLRSRLRLMPYRRANRLDATSSKATIKYAARGMV